MESVKNWNLAVVNELILPVYTRTANLAKTMAKENKAYCAAPNESTLQPLQAEFINTFLSWQAASFYTLFGPAHELTRYRFLNYPDKRGVTQKHLLRALQASDNKTLDEIKQGKGSIALQGFSALERLIFDETSTLFKRNEQSEWVCKLSMAMSENIARMTTQILNQWQNNWLKTDSAFIELFTLTTDKARHEENSTLLLKSLLNGVQNVSVKLKFALSSDITQAKPDKVEMPFSKISLQAAKAEFEAVKSLYYLRFKKALDNQPLLDAIDKTLADIKIGLDKIPAPLSEAIIDKDGREKVRVAEERLFGFEQFLRVSLPPELGLTAGFNSEDGDGA